MVVAGRPGQDHTGIFGNGGTLRRRGLEGDRKGYRGG